MKKSLKKLSALILSFIFIFIISNSFIKQTVYALTNTSIATVKSPYDGTLKEKNYKGLQTLNYKVEPNTYYAANTMYDAIYNALINFQSSVDLSSYSPSDNNQVFDTVDTVINDHPEIFYFDWSNTTLSSGGSYYMLNLKYLYSSDECKAMEGQLMNKVNSIISSVTSTSMTELQKELAIHDYIVSNVTYDITKYNNNTLTDDDHSVWGPLMQGTGVCDGYSKSMKLLLNKVGIACIVIVSDSMNHAWNIVNIGGNYYHVDSTWDDPVPETNRIGYYYFNVPDSVISDSNHRHTWTNSAYPACTNNQFSYFEDVIGNSLWDYTRNNDTIYYTNSNYNLCSLSIDGTNNTCLDSNSSIGGQPCIFGDYVYFLYSNSDNTEQYAYKINMNNMSGDPIQVASANCSSGNLYIKNGILNINSLNYSSETTTNYTSLDISQKEDVNKDGYVDIKDIALTAKNYNALTASLDSSMSAEDVNKDGIIDLYDLVLISKQLN